MGGGVSRSSRVWGLGSVYKILTLDGPFNQRRQVTVGGGFITFKRVVKLRSLQRKSKGIS